MIWHCSKCGQRMMVVAGAPIHCACGWTFRDENDGDPERRIEQVCQFRGDHTGQFLKRRCRGCSPNVPVYRCAIKRLCTEAATSDGEFVQHCGSCRSYTPRER